MSDFLLRYTSIADGRSGRRLPSYMRIKSFMIIVLVYI